MLKITSPIRHQAALAAALAIVGGISFATPSFAAATDQDDANYTQDNAPTPPKAQSHAKTHAMSPAMNVENRIKTLHDKLKITSAQEDDWAKVAQSMRDNETKIHQLIQARHANPDNMTAIDDLQSYQQITQAHADGLQNLTAAFTALYNDMSDDQKQNADVVFGRFEGHRDNAPAKKHS